MSNNTERLLKLTDGEDLTKPSSITDGILKEVLVELQKERLAKAREEAHKLMRECLELEEKKKKAKAEFENAMKKYDKLLGKLLSRLEGNLNNHPEEGQTEEGQTEEGQTE